MTAVIEIKVPDIGDFSDVPVIEVLVAEGDQVKAEDGLVTLESDKATMEIPSPAAGIIRELKLKLDDTVSEGDLVAILESSESEESAGAPVSEPSETATTEPEPSTPEFSAIWRSGASSARRTMAIPAFWSLFSPVRPSRPFAA